MIRFRNRVSTARGDPAVSRWSIKGAGKIEDLVCSTTLISPAACFGSIKFARKEEDVIYSTGLDAVFCWSIGEAEDKVSLEARGDARIVIEEDQCPCVGEGALEVSWCLKRLLKLECPVGL